MLTNDELQAIRARADAATPGPWTIIPAEPVTPDVLILREKTGLEKPSTSQRRPPVSDTIKAIAQILNTTCPGVCGHIAATTIYDAHVKPLEDALETAQSMSRTFHDVARAAWGGEIPSPLPGHTHMTEEEFCEKYNCPWCGGSGHVDDCDEADRAVKQRLAKAKSDKAALVEALEGMCRLYDSDDGTRSATEYQQASAALSRVKGEA